MQPLLQVIGIVLAKGINERTEINSVRRPIVVRKTSFKFTPVDYHVSLAQTQPAVYQLEEKIARRLAATKR